ncbi:MAG: ABC transporter permease [bacterium]|nr:ABC transporter permease [bacterium]MDO5462516.1 ABC transporter permease [bacterium]
MILTREVCGSMVQRGLAAMGRTVFIIVIALLSAPLILFRRDIRADFSRQMYVVGIGTLPVSTVVALFTGMILSLQLGIAFRQLSQELMVASTLAYAMLREMGPFMMGIILASCVGSSMAAQLGAMKINEEITALEMMSVNPVRYLVTARMWAMLIMAPLISFYTCVIAFMGGALVAYTQLDVPFLQFMQGVIDASQTKDLWVGLIKATFFGVMICGISCNVGFGTSNGAVGVGASTRRAVIYSFLAILIGGYFVTRCCYAL